LRSSGCIVTEILAYMQFKHSVAMYHPFFGVYYDIIKNKIIYGIHYCRLI
jgi:hypothetical protein